MGYRPDRHDAVNEDDIKDDYAPPRRGGRGRSGNAKWSERSMNGKPAEARPANPWVRPEQDAETESPASHHCKACDQPVPKATAWDLDMIYDRRAPYSLDGDG